MTRYRGIKKAPSGWMQNVPEGEIPSEKRDFLGECNAQGMSPRDFMSVFCLHCRNHACLNAGWASSRWEARMMTQEERLLYKPSFAQPDDPRFQPVREVDFPMLLQEAIRLESRRGSDDWDNPLPEELERPLEETIKLNMPKVIPEMVSEKAPEKAPESPSVNLPASQPAAQPAPQAPKPALPVMPEIKNTSFPEEGVMLDGSPAPAPPVRQAPAPPVDPWAPKPVERIVAPGARIKMGG